MFKQSLNCPYCGYPFSKYVAKEKRIQSLSNIRKSITSNRKKILILIVLVIIGIIVLIWNNQRIYHKELRYKNSQNAYNRIIESLSNYHRANTIYNSIDNPKTKDEFKEKDKAELSMRLSINALKEEYSWIIDDHKNELRKWISVNLSNNDIEGILNEFDDKDGIFQKQ